MRPHLRRTRRQTALRLRMQHPERAQLSLSLLGARALLCFLGSAFVARACKHFLEELLRRARRSKLRERRVEVALHLCSCTDRLAYQYISILALWGLKLPVHEAYGGLTLPVHEALY